MFLGVSDSPVMWAWASIRPGISVLPPTSMIAASRTSTGLGDTATMRPSFTRTLNDGCSSANPSRTRLALVKSVWGIRNLLRDNTTLLYVPGRQLRLVPLVVFQEQTQADAERPANVVQLVTAGPAPLERRIESLSVASLRFAEIFSRSGGLGVETRVSDLA